MVPLFLARNTDGTIDFYMNCVVGLVHKYYGDELVRSLFDAWEGDIRQAMLDDLTWLYLESAVYALELPRRPVLSALRRAHADYFFGIQYKLSRQEWMAKNQLVYSMQAARWRAVQGRTPPVMTLYEKDLDAALSPETPPKPDELKAALLAVYAKFELFNGTVHQKAGLHLHLDGLLASLNSVAKLPYHWALDGISNTQTINPDALGHSEGERIENLVQVMDGYFDQGAHHLNVNVFGKEKLIDAMEHPEKEEYANFTIRVSGYAVKFIDLTREQQMDVISRTCHAAL